MQRLKTRAQFQAVLSGQIVSRTAHFALHRLDLSVPTELLSSPTTGPVSERPQALFGVGGVWMGAMVPKRWAKRAVTRNTIKRQVYTLSTGNPWNWSQTAHVVRLRAGFDRKQFISATSEQLKQAVREELTQLMSRVRPIAARVAKLEPAK
ncbi:ribonuclease P protein component [Variovorax sp. HJSM1_2]|uniref:ribonuclease P protein component n=1 Tax=Variovorax sp. HJSM1_2 TaxID=3366263 RepID=UPI003BE6F26C